MFRPADSKFKAERNEFRVLTLSPCVWEFTGLIVLRLYAPKNSVPYAEII